MSLDNPNGIESSVSNKTKQRRTFLKRASAGVLLTSLPAQSVWARGGLTCTTSGAMSGNMSGINRHKNCDKPSLPKGRSPGSWKKFMNADADSIHNNVRGHLRSVFPNVGNSQLGCLLLEIQQVGIHNDMVVSTELVDTSFISNIYTALPSSGPGSGGVDFNLAAVWLNVYFNLGNFVGSVGNVNRANEVVNNLLGYIFIQAREGFTGGDDYEIYGFKESSSSTYRPISC